MLLGIPLCLIGGAMIETPLIGYLHGENGLAALIFGILFGAMFLFVGGMFCRMHIQELRKNRKEDSYRKELLEVLKPGFKEATGKSYLDRMLHSFREHYSEFLSNPHVSENDAVQKDVTQIFRNVMQFQKNRLTHLGLTCEMVIRRMQYTSKEGINIETYSDGKYNVTEVQEEVAAKTIYKKNGKEIYTKQDKDTANYTIIKAQQVGEDIIICPNCGAETTREALLDGCDYCGTKFTVEDLDSRIAVFAFRPDYKLRYEKYLRQRNKLLINGLLAAIAAVFLGFTTYAVLHFSELLEEASGGIILTILADLFAILIASPVYIISFLIVYGIYIIPVVAILGLISWQITKAMRTIKNSAMLARDRELEIRRSDPNFSLASFYSSVQNKLASVIFAEDLEQIQAFAAGDLSPMLGKYANVVGVDVNRMEIKRYYTDPDLQHMDVKAVLLLTRYTGKKCYTRRERIRVQLVKAASCKTQVVCAPAVLTCKGCGSSLDLLRGKRCSYCGRYIDLTQHDWVIQGMQRGIGTFLNRRISK